ncbi:MAG TPA: hypothetical protein VN783_12085 [Thermoanaerobaculia bacterium]|nr:hypothetical protein [Thermoanaerobaculia bacterium]
MSKAMSHWLVRIVVVLLLALALAPSAGAADRLAPRPRGIGVSLDVSGWFAAIERWVLDLAGRGGGAPPRSVLAASAGPDGDEAAEPGAASDESGGVIDPSGGTPAPRK